MQKSNSQTKQLPMLALDSIPKPSANAQNITGLVKQSGRITGYQLSGGQTLSKADAVSFAKQGGIAGVGIAHRNGTEYLKSLPDGTEANNLSNLPSVAESAVTQQGMY